MAKRKTRNARRVRTSKNRARRKSRTRRVRRRRRQSGGHMNLNMKLLNVKINKVKKLFHIYKPLKNVLKSDDQPTELVNWMTVE